jgi:hypothetical protein
MKFTLEHAIILILTVALIYYVVNHRNLLTDLFRIPDRGHPELKRVKEKHGLAHFRNTLLSSGKHLGSSALQTGKHLGSSALHTTGHVLGSIRHGAFELGASI